VGPAFLGLGLFVFIVKVSLSPDWSSKISRSDSCLPTQFQSFGFMDVMVFHSNSVATQKKSGRPGANPAAGLTEFCRTAATRVVKFMNLKIIDGWRYNGVGLFLARPIHREPLLSRPSHHEVNYG
jgi:hypothetical protein